MNFDGVSCWVWVFSQAKRLLFEIVLYLLNASGLWIKYLLVKRIIVKSVFLCFFGWIKSCFIALLSDCRVLSFHVYNLSELLPLWIAVIYVIESYTKRWSNYSHVSSLMCMGINLTVLAGLETIWTLFIMTICRKKSNIEWYLICNSYCLGLHLQ